MLSALLERIEALDEDLNTFITVVPEKALEEAARGGEGDPYDRVGSPAVRAAVLARR